MSEKVYKQKKRRKLSKKELKVEIIKCGKDPVYFLCNYAKIVHPKKGEVTFKTYDFQNDLLRRFRDHRYNILLKARQLGASTIVAGYIAWLILFHKHKEVIVMATKQDKAKNILRKVRMIIDGLPEWLKITKYKTDNRVTIELTNGSRVGAESTAKDAGRSDSLALLVLDEAAHIENMDNIWTAIYPTLSTGGSVIALSTPDGVGNWFHKTCMGAKNGQNNFVLSELPWSVHPDRDEEWFKNETRNMDERSIAQELLCNFNASVKTVISPDDIERLKKMVREPLYKVGPDRNYWIWKEFDSQYKYLISVDVARGDGEDFTAISVLSLENMTRVAEYRGKIDTDILEETILPSICKDYGNPMLAIENNNIGIEVAKHMVKEGYENVYYSKKGSHEYVSPIEAISNSQAVPGFTTSMKTRPLLVMKLEEYIRNKSLVSYSSRFVDELTTFIWNNGRPEHQKGYNDDLIFSQAIGCWIRDTALFKSIRDAKYNINMLQSIVVSRQAFDSRLPEQTNEKHMGRVMEEKIKQRKRETTTYPWIMMG